MDIIVGIVAYQKAFLYLEECLMSVERQNDEDFTVILINDDIKISKVQELLKKFGESFCSKVIIIDRYDEKLKPYLLRIEMIKEAYYRKADILVFIDCDDKMSENRIKCIRQQFEPEYAFFYNELLDFQGKAVMSALPDYTMDYQDIGEYNYLGMSNGTINLQKFSLDFIESLKDGKTNIFDWYLYSRILLEKRSGKKIQNCYTYYRIYEENIAGQNRYNRNGLERELEIKIQHYSLLKKKSDYFNDLFIKYSKIKVEDVILRKGNGYWWGLINYDSNCTCKGRFKGITG